MVRSLTARQTSAYTAIATQLPGAAARWSDAGRHRGVGGCLAELGLAGPAPRVRAARRRARATRRRATALAATARTGGGGPGGARARPAPASDATRG